MDTCTAHGISWVLLTFASVFIFIASLAVLNMGRSFGRVLNTLGAFMKELREDRAALVEYEKLLNERVYKRQDDIERRVEALQAAISP